jgi:hypothetical protein
VSWWPANEVLGSSTATDLIGGHHGTFENASVGPGKFGNAFLFGGNGQVVIPDDPAWILGSSPFTIACLVNFNQLSARAGFLSHTEGGDFRNKWTFFYDEVGASAPVNVPALRFHINGPMGPRDPIVYEWEPDLNRWYHVAVTRSGSSYALYLDGQQVKTSDDATVIGDAAAPLTIGSAEGLFLNGSIDDVVIYDTALSPTQIEIVSTGQVCTM